MQNPSKTITVFNFKNTCFRCFRRIEYPLLGDFLYGDLLFQTSDGQDFYYVQLLDNKTFKFICEFLDANKTKKQLTRKKF